MSVMCSHIKKKKIGHPDWVKNRVDTGFQTTARFGKTNCTLRKNGERVFLTAKTNRERKATTSNYPIMSVCKIFIGVTRQHKLQHYSAIF